MEPRTPAEWKTLFESEAFARQTEYYGPLGVEYTPAGTHLRLWAPTAKQAAVNLYRRGTGGACVGTLPLQQQDKGVWSIYLPGDQHGKYYDFTLTTPFGTCNAADPYARSAGVNGVRSMIFDPARVDPQGWERDVRPVIPPARRSVWEVSVRDFSQDPASGVHTAWRGKFLAFTQQGTTLSSDGIHPTCLNYLKRLGVSYVQLMPIFDFGSVDESRPLTRQYNWGYDPTNFNVPEGSYSTDPTRGEVRVRECKQMIAALHAAGIGVVMDVVYNHMYRSDNVLNRVVPLYYFRQNDDGSLSNGSGCGNEFASERPMARRYLIDSVLYWAREYHIDGFRFDLMGLYDVETMNLLRAELDKLPGGRDILMYGEPWQGGCSTLHRYEANKNNLNMLNERIGIFCDNTRDAIKGGCFDARETGYVEGKPGSFWDIGASVAAWCRSEKLPPHAPGQIISYVSAHDNFTLWDKLLMVRYARPEFAAVDKTALAQNRLAAGIYLTSMGLPFWQAGEEFARTKKGQGNSYRSSPALNRLDWQRAQQFHELVDYYRGLIGLRRYFPRLSALDTASPAAIQFFSLEQPLVGWQLPANFGDGALWQALCVFYNPTGQEKTVPLPEGNWKLLSDGISSSLWRGESQIRSGQTVLLPTSATIFGKT
ncbi:MAG TPA: type I pullulanase [Faecalibacterium sp.]|nr:type I pullulanase [Faecalibacterium sp.]